MEFMDSISENRLFPIGKVEEMEILGGLCESLISKLTDDCEHNRAQ